MTSPSWFGSSSDIRRSTENRKTDKSFRELTILLGPAAHCFGATIQVLPADHVVSFKHRVDLLVDVFGLKFANIAGVRTCFIVVALSLRIEIAAAYFWQLLHLHARTVILAN